MADSGIPQPNDNDEPLVTLSRNSNSRVTRRVEGAGHPDGGFAAHS